MQIDSKQLKYKIKFEWYIYNYNIFLQIKQYQINMNQRSNYYQTYINRASEKTLNQITTTTQVNKAGQRNTEPLGRTTDYLQTNAKYNQVSSRDQLLNNRIHDKISSANPRENLDILKVAPSTEAFNYSKKESRLVQNSQDPQIIRILSNQPSSQKRPSKQDSLVRAVNDYSEKIQTEQYLKDPPIYAHRDQLQTLRRQLTLELKKTMIDEFHEMLQAFKSKELSSVKVQIGSISKEMQSIRQQHIQLKTKLDRDHSYMEKIDNNYKKIEISANILEEQKKQYEKQSEKIRMVGEQLEGLYKNIESKLSGAEERPSARNDQEEEQIVSLENKLQKEREERLKLQQKNREYVQNMQKMRQNNKSNSPSPNKEVLVKPIFISPLLSEYDGEQYIKDSIQDFTKLKIESCELIFKKDEFNDNFGNYINTDPFPYILLMESDKGFVFGAFGEGIQSSLTQRWRKDKGITQKFKAFLFNLNKKQLFKNQRSTRIDSASFNDGFLRFGNSEIILRNQFLSSVKVYAGKIFGQSYFYVRSKEMLIGQNKEDVPLKRVQIHRIKFERSL